MNEEKARLDHERDDGFERSIRKENFDFNITFVTTFEIEEKRWRGLEGNRNRVSANLSVRFFLFSCFPNIALGLFFPSNPVYQYYSLSKHGWNDKTSFIYFCWRACVVASFLKQIFLGRYSNEKIFFVRSEARKWIIVDRRSFND